MRALLRSSILVVLATACGFPPPPDVPDVPGAPQDGGTDAADLDVSMVPRIVASNTVSRSDLVAGIAPFTVPAGKTYVIDTDQGSMFDAGNGNAPLRVAGEGVKDGVFYRADDKNRAFFAFQSLTVGENAILRAVGTRALILIADGSVEIHGIIDVSAGHCSITNDALSCAGPGGGRGSDGTPASVAGGCSPGARGAGTTASSGGSGGGGFASSGGAGGASNSSATGVSAGGSGGTGVNCPGPGLDPIQGGSGGERGGTLSIFISSKPGGGGGGAVQVTSYTSIAFVSPTTSDTSGVWAGGAGGSGGEAGGTGPIGGSGGGSGGAILLEAAVVEIRSGVVLAANGGGGGSGARATYGEAGRFGSTPASGGLADTGAGGAGAALNANAADGSLGVDIPQMSTAAGGGGGGGGGRIRINAVVLTNLSGQAVVSPAPSLNVPAATE